MGRTPAKKTQVGKKRKRSNPRASSSAQPAKKAKSNSVSHVWIIRKTSGYHSDGFHGAMEPSIDIKAVCRDTPSKIKEGKNLCKELVIEGPGILYEEAEEMAEIEISETDNKTIYSWAPPDSEYSVVTMEKFPLDWTAARNRADSDVDDFAY